MPHKSRKCKTNSHREIIMTLEQYDNVIHIISGCRQTSTLNLANKGIRDLSDVLCHNNGEVERTIYNNVKYIDLSNNEIASIKQLNKFKNVVGILAPNNKIKQIYSIPQSVSKLYLNDNEIKFFNLRKKYENINIINLSRNNLESFKFLNYMPNLTQLSLNQTKLKDDFFSAIFSLKELRYLVLNGVFFEKKDIKYLKQQIKMNKNINSLFFQKHI